MEIRPTLYNFKTVQINAYRLKYIFSLQGKILGNSRNRENRDIILANQTLVIRQIERHTAGNYTCIAANRLGESASAPLHLHVKCKKIIEILVICQFKTRNVYTYNIMSWKKKNKKKKTNISQCRRFFFCYKMRLCPEERFIFEN